MRKPPPYTNRTVRTTRMGTVVSTWPSSIKRRWWITTKLTITIGKVAIWAMPNVGYSQCDQIKCCFGAGLANLSDDLDKGCVGKNPSLAIDNLKRSCQLGSGMACQLLSQLFLIGFPGFVDKHLSACLKYHFEANGQLNFLEDRTELEAILNSLIAMRTPSSGVQ